MLSKAKYSGYPCFRGNLQARTLQYVQLVSGLLLQDADLANGDVRIVLQASMS